MFDWLTNLFSGEVKENLDLCNYFDPSGNSSAMPVSTKAYCRALTKPMASMSVATPDSANYEG
jgi:hypothetical protein